MLTKYANIYARSHCKSCIDERVLMTLETERVGRPRFSFRPSRRDMLKFGTATAVGAGAAAVGPVLPANADVPVVSPVASIPLELAPAPTSVTASYVSALNAFSIGHVLVDPTLAQGTLAAQITIPTYEGSGVAVHPSVYFNPNGWNGYEYWMAYTPYPSAKSQLENPSIAVSHDGNSWITPTGLANPIEPVPPGGVNHNSDPNILVGNDGLMYLFWRTVGVPYAGETWYGRTSSDGLNWSDRVVIREDAQSVRRMVSPSFTQLADGSWVAYAVDIVPRPYTVVRLQAASLAGFKGATPQPVKITGNSGQPWHIDVHRVSGLWHMLVQDGGPNGGDLWVAVSADGLDFQAGSPCIKRGVSQWDSVYYKSCFVPAVKNGVLGWDTWLTGASFAASGSIMGRSFIGFSGSPAPVIRSEAAAAPDPSILETALMVHLLAAKSGTYPWIAGDSFSRPDNASIGNADSGQPWIANVGTMKLANRAATPSATANTRSVIEVGTANHWVSAQIDSPATATAQHWLLARFQDSDNFYRFGIYPGGGALQLQKIVAGALSTVSIVPGSAPALPGTTIGLRCIGTTFEMFVSNAKVSSVTDASLTAGTKAGIQANDGTAVFRAFTVRVS